MYLKLDDHGPVDLVPERGPRPLPKGPIRDWVPIRRERIKPGTKRNFYLRYGKPLPKPWIEAPADFRFPSRYPGRAAAARILPRVVPALGLALAAYEAADMFEIPSAFVSKRRGWAGTAGWVLRNDCGIDPSPYYVTFYSGTVLNCAGLQAHQTVYGPYVDGQSIAPGSSGATQTMVVCKPSTVSGRWDNTQQLVWTGARPAGTTLKRNKVWAVPMNPALDPNILRALPDLGPAYGAVVSLEPDLEKAPEAWQWSNTPPGNPLPPAHTRQLPRQNTREKKAMSKAARIGIALWALMDTVSELTEIGGALYDALPKEFQTCGKFGLNIGQYGSSLNDCMASALWKHWDKLDTEAAVLNIAKNVAEDMTIGAFHKLLDRMLPPGISIEKTAFTYFTSKLQWEAYVSKQLKRVFTILGL